MTAADRHFLSRACSQSLQMRAFVVRVVVKNAFGRAIQVFVLAAVQAPKKGREPQAAQKQGNRNQNDQDVHGADLPRRRSAFNVTNMDDVDMTAAASKGVT